LKNKESYRNRKPEFHDLKLLVGARPSIDETKEDNEEIR